MSDADRNRSRRASPRRGSDAPMATMNGKPNIVLVLMDNLGWGELGAYGGGVLRGAPTPRIDTLASEGMRLLNFNVEAQCTPSRAALLTGRYAIRTGNGSVPIDTPLYGLVQWEYSMAKMLSDTDSSEEFGRPSHSSKPWSMGKRPSVMAEMPLAEHAGRIARLRPCITYSTRAKGSMWDRRGGCQAGCGKVGLCG